MSRQGLPRFTSQGQVQQGGVADSSAGSRSLTELGQRLQQFGSQQLQRTSQQRAAQQGELAGLDPNFRPSGVPTAATETFNRAALGANRAMMSSDAILGTQRNKLIAQQSSPDAAVQAQTFQQLQSQDANELVNQAPAANKPVIQNVIAHQTASSMLDFQKSIFHQQQIKADAQSIQSDNALNAATNEQINSVHWDSADPELPKKQLSAAGQFLKQRIDAINLRVQGSLLTPDQGNRLTKKAKDDFNMQVLTSQFETKLKQGSEQANDFLNFVRNPFVKKGGFPQTKSVLKGYNNIQRGVLAHRIQKLFNQHKNTTAVSGAYLTTLISDEKRAVLNGASPNVQLRSYIEQHAPKRIEEYDRLSEDWQLTHAGVQNILSMPLSAQDRALASSKPTDTKDPGFGRDLGNFNTTQSMVMSARNAIKNDPAKWFLSHPEMSNPLNQQMARSQVGVDFDKMPANGWKPLPINVMRQLALSEEHYTGKDISESSVTTNNMAAGMVNQLNSLSSAAEKAQLMQRWSQQSGALFPNLVRDLKQKGKMSVDDEYLIGVRPNDPDIDVYQKLTSTTKQDRTARLKGQEKDIIDAKHNSAYESYISSLEAYQSGRGLDAHINNTTEFLQDYAEASMLTDKKPISSASKAWENAQNVFSGRFNYKELEGRTIRIPPKYNAAHVINYAVQNKGRLLKNFNFTSDPFISKGATTGEAKRQTFDMLMTSGGFVSNNTNDSLIFVDHNGQAIFDDKGNNLTVKFSDIATNTHADAVAIQESINRGNFERERATFGLDPTVKPSDPIKKQEEVIKRTLRKVGLAGTPPKTRKTLIPGIERIV